MTALYAGVRGVEAGRATTLAAPLADEPLGPLAGLPESSATGEPADPPLPARVVDDDEWAYSAILCSVIYSALQDGDLRWLQGPVCKLYMRLLGWNDHLINNALRRVCAGEVDIPYYGSGPQWLT